jgi:Uncharacterized protein conserved in bacteria
MSATIDFEEIYQRQLSHMQICTSGVVSQILNDDTVGRKHQRFIVRIGHHQTIMVINNIDIFPRLEPLSIGDTVEICGEYVWNRHGGIVHWTHEDPHGVHKDGYVKLVTGSNYYPADEKTPVPLGKYRHYKGNEYEVLGFAVHSETLEDMVIYKALYGDMKTWVRPLAMWSELVETADGGVERFAFVGEQG